MRKIPLALLIVASAAGGAVAQPGQTDPSPYPPPPAQPPPPQPYPQPAPMQPQPYAPPPQGYVPQGYVAAQLSADDAELLSKGEISDTAHVGGTVAALFIGFGIGQAVQGRYGETGWIFTLGEGASYAAVIYGATQIFVSCLAPDSSNCSGNNNTGATTLFVGGLIALGVFRIWGVVDAATQPSKHNQRVRELRMRLGIPQPMYTKVVPYVTKTHDSGAAAGITFRF